MAPVKTSRFRVKKLSRSTALSVHREEEIDSTEYESLANEKADTGVEKAEEKVRSHHVLVDLFLSLDSPSLIPSPPEFFSPPSIYNFFTETRDHKSLPHSSMARGH